jgi:hypothetical protein
VNRDPLSVFLHEKVAVSDVPTSAAPDRHVTNNPDPQSLDPGERAMAGLMAAGGSIAAKAVPWVIKSGLNMLATSGNVPWSNAVASNGAKSVADVMAESHSPSSKLLGLFNITSRERTPRQALDLERAFAGPTKLQEIQHVVDSFIDTHHLTEHGVRMNFSRGPLGSSLGPRYHIPTKQVFFPSVDKETVLHELGHAADYTGSALGRFRGFAEPVLRKGALIALPIALVAGDRIKEMMPGTIDDKAISFMQDHAPEIMGATLAATSLYPEAKASFLAVRHIAKTEGSEAAVAALKKLAPAWGTYLLGAIPAVVGMSLARKYMRQARAEKDLQKTSGAIGSAIRDLVHGVTDSALDIAHVGKEIGRQTVSMIQEPGLIRRVTHAAKEIGTSPEFVYGALGSAIPATMGALYLYGTESGNAIRKRIHPDNLNGFLSESGKKIPGTSMAKETWREQNPLRFAGLVAAGAAMSGGILAKFFSDLQRVL